MENAQELSKLQKLISEVRALQGSSIMVVFEIGKRWKLIHDEKLWKALDYVHTFREFCEKEAQASHATVYNMIGIYEKFGHLVKKRPINCDITRLIRALPFATPENAEEWVIRAENLTKEDYEDFLREARGKIPKDKCQHEVTELWSRCKECGKWIKPIE
ncbi:MAG: hypothetical protein ACUVWN_04575 [bacterium]